MSLQTLFGDAIKAGGGSLHLQTSLLLEAGELSQYVNAPNQDLVIEDAELLPTETGQGTDIAVVKGKASFPSLGMSGVDVILNGRTIDDTQTQLWMTAADSGWNFQQGWSDLPPSKYAINGRIGLQDSLLFLLKMSNTSIVVSTFQGADENVSFSKGINLYADVSLGDPLWDGIRLITSMRSLSFAGTLTLSSTENVPPLIDLKAELDSAGFNLGKRTVDGLSVDLGTSLLPVGEYRTQAKLSGAFSLDDTSDYSPIVVSVDLFQGDNLWVLSAELPPGAYSLNNGFIALTHLISGTTADFTLPDPLSKIASFELSSVKLGIIPINKEILFIQVVIDSQETWKPVSGITLGKISTGWTFTNPLDSALRSVDGYVEAEFMLGNKQQVVLEAGIEMPDPLIYVVLPYGSVINLTEAVEHFMGTAAGLPEVDIVYLRMAVDPKNKTYSFSGVIKGEWPDVISLNGCQAGLDSMEVNIQRTQTGFTGMISAEFQLLGGTFEVSAEKPADGSGWLFSGALAAGSQINLADLVKLFISSEPSEQLNLPQIDELAFAVNTDTKDSSFRAGFKWTPDFLVKLGFNEADGRIELNKDGKTNYSGQIEGDIVFHGLMLTAIYQFDADKSEIVFKAGSMSCQYDSSSKTLTFQMGDMTLGDILRYLFQLASPGATVGLPSPWDKLLSISLSGLELKVNFDSKVIEVDYVHEFILGFIDIKALGVVYSKQYGKSKVNIVLKGDFLGQTYGAANPLQWDALNDQPPKTPGAGSALFDLEYFGMGQHVALKDIAAHDLNTVSKVIGKMESAMQPVADPTQNPLAVLENTLIFDKNSNWLFGTKFTIMNTLSLSAIFNDPEVYGLLIALRGEKAGGFNGLQFEILYRKISESLGLYHMELTLPDAMRHLEFGEVSVTLPVVDIDIYTNGNFRVNFGFPASLTDFSNSFCIQVFPFIGYGGFYFAVLNGSTSTHVPAITNGTFSPVIEFGLALSLGVGKTIDIGILSGGIQVTALGMLQGVIGWFNPSDASVPSDRYYWLQGTLAIDGKVYASVDFGIIKASVSLDAFASVTATLESYQPLYIDLYAEVEVSVGVKIIFFTIHFHFSAHIHEHFTIGSASQTPWIIGDSVTLQETSHRLLNTGEPVASLRPVRKRLMLALAPVSVGDTLTLDLYLMPVITKALSTDFPASHVLKQENTADMVACGLLLFIENGIDPDADSAHQLKQYRGDRPDTAFDALMERVLRWLLQALEHEAQSVTLDDLQDLSILLSHPEVIRNRFSYTNLAAFLHHNVTFRLKLHPDPPSSIAANDFDNQLMANLYNADDKQFISSVYQTDEDGNYVLVANATTDDISRIWNIFISIGFGTASASFFPMIPDLAVTTFGGEEINFTNNVLCSDEYEEKIDIYLASMLAEYEQSGYSGNDTEDGDDEQELLLHSMSDPQEDTVAMAIFKSYFLMMAKQAVQDAIDLMHKSASPIAIDSLIADLKSGGYFNNAAAMISRFLLHGMRLPDPNDDHFNALTIQDMKDPAKLGGIITYPLYSVTGQEVALAVPMASTAITVGQTNTPVLNTIFIGSDGAQAAHLILNLLPCELDQITSYQQSQLSSAGVTLQTMQEFSMVPDRHSVKQSVVWNDSHDRRTLWMLPKTLLTQLSGPNPPESGRLMEHQRQSGSEPPAVNELKHYEWSSLVAFQVQKLPATTAPGAGNVYVLLGVNADEMDILLQIWTFMSKRLAKKTDKKEDDDPTYSIDVQILYPADPADNSAQGWISDTLNPVLTSILKTNLSTLSHSALSLKLGMFAAEDSASTVPGEFYAGLQSDSDITQFLRFLWECSVERSGGFHFQYDNGTGKGLPDVVFAAGDTAKLSLLIKVKETTDHTLNPWHNCIIVTEDIQLSSFDLYVQTEKTHQQNAIPAGNVGFTAMRPKPQGGMAAQGLASVQDELSAMFHLIGNAIEENAYFHHSAAALPVGPIVDRNDPNTADPAHWYYKQVVPVSKYALNNPAIRCSALPDPAMNPYAGVEPGAAVQLDFAFQDMLGNRTAPDSALPSLSIPIGYHDSLLNMTAWPSIRYSYVFEQRTGKTVLQFQSSFDPSKYVVSSSQGFEAAHKIAQSHLKTLRKLYYQLAQPDLSFEITTTMGTLDAEDGGDYKAAAKAELSSLVQSAYVFMTAISKLAPYLYNSSSKESLEQVAAAYLMPVSALAAANRQIALSSMVNETSIDIPLYHVVKAGDTIDNIAGANLDTDYDALALRVKDIKLAAGAVIIVKPRSAGRELKADMSFSDIAKVMNSRLTDVIYTTKATDGTTTSIVINGFASSNQNALLQSKVQLKVEGFTVSAEDGFDTLQLALNRFKTEFASLTLKGNPVLDLNYVAACNENLPGVWVDVTTLTFPNYVVQANDTLYTIAQNMDPATDLFFEEEETPEQKIMMKIAMFLKDNHAITELFTPGTAIQTGSKKISLQAEDTFASLASAYQVTVDQLASNNTALTLKPVMPVTIPGRMDQLYYLQSSDTLNAIIERHDSLSLRTIVAVNADSLGLFNTATTITLNRIAVTPTSADSFATLSDAFKMTALDFAEAIADRKGIWASNAPIRLVNDYSVYKIRQGDTLDRLLSQCSDWTMQDFIGLNQELQGIFAAGYTIHNGVHTVTLQPADSFVTVNAVLEYATVVDLANAYAQDPKLLRAGAAVFIPYTLVSGNSITIDELSQTYNWNASQFAKTHGAVNNLLVPSQAVNYTDIPSLQHVQGISSVGTVTTRINETFVSLAANLNTLIKNATGTHEELITIADLAAVNGQLIVTEGTYLLPCVSAAELTFDLKPAYKGSMLPVSVDLVMNRDETLMSPAFKGLNGYQSVQLSIPPHSVSGESGAASVREFARRFEQAFPSLKLAVGSNAGGSKEGPPKLWTVNFDASQGGITVSATRSPNYFSLVPLSKTLWSKDGVDIRVYESGNVLISNTKSFHNVDLDLYAKRLYETMDLLFTPEYASAVFSVNPQAFDQMMLAKQKIAKALSHGVDWIINVENSDGSLETAKEALFQQLLIRLSNAYKTDVLLQLSIDVTSAYSDPSVIPPRFSGKIVTNTDPDTVQPGVNLTTGKFSLGQTAGEGAKVTFLMNVKNEEHNRDVPLQAQFVINEVEYDIQSNPEAGNYESSSWLSFIIPINQSENESILNMLTLPALDVPIPLRSYPDIPVMSNQQAVSVYQNCEGTASSGFDWEQVRGWNYAFDVQHAMAEQDTMYLKVQFSQLSGTTDNVISSPEEKAALFAALAQFNYSYDAIHADLPILLNSGNEERKSRLIDALIIFMQDAADAYLTPSVPSRAPIGDEAATDTYEYKLEYKHELNQATYTLTLTSHSPYKYASADISYVTALEQGTVPAGLLDILIDNGAVPGGGDVGVFHVDGTYWINDAKDSKIVYCYIQNKDTELEIYPDCYPVIYEIGNDKPLTRQILSGSAVYKRSESQPNVVKPYLSFRFEYRNLNSINRQNGWSSCQVTRNENLAEGIPLSSVNPSMIYKSPAVMFSNQVSPLVRINDYIPLKNLLSKPTGVFHSDLQAFFEQCLANDAYNGQREVKISVSAGYPLAVTPAVDGLSEVDPIQGETIIFTYLPVLFIPRAQIDTRGPFVKTLADAVENQAAGVGLDVNNIRYLLSLSVFSALDSKNAPPLLEIANLYYNK